MDEWMSEWVRGVRNESERMNERSILISIHPKKNLTPFTHILPTIPNASDLRFLSFLFSFSFFFASPHYRFDAYKLITTTKFIGIFQMEGIFWGFYSYGLRGILEGEGGRDGVGWVGERGVGG